MREACRIDDLAAWGRKNAVAAADAPENAGRVLLPVDEPAAAFWTNEEPFTPPTYPASALQSGAEGCVMLGIMVGADGAPTGLRVMGSEVSGPKRARKSLEEASLQRASQWRFAPGPDNPTRMPAFIQIPVDFAIDDPPPRIKCCIEAAPQASGPAAG